ncbi:MAG: hypothetical protein QGD96_07860 [Anaerolineae bacterium]|nr:hypothetical protein [Anaerolineae bacterium]
MRKFIGNQTVLSVLGQSEDKSFDMGSTVALYASKGYDVTIPYAMRGW